MVLERLRGSAVGWGTARSGDGIKPGSNWQDQEAWVLSIHGTEVRFMTALFTVNNLQYDGGQHKIPKVIITLLQYLKTGDPAIAPLHAVKANA